MQVSVKYFASLRELMGESSRLFDIEEKSSVDDLWQQIKNKKNVNFENVMATVNMQYVKSNHQLHDGDEVAFFAAVAGG